MPRKKVTSTVYVDPEQKEALDRIRDRSKVPVAELFRQAVDIVIDAHDGPTEAQDTIALAEAYAAEVIGTEALEHTEELRILAVGFQRLRAQRIELKKQLRDAERRAAHYHELVHDIARYVEKRSRERSP